MRVPLSWLREYAPVELSATALAELLVRAGLEVETIHTIGDDIRGVVVAEVLEVEELTGFKKPIRYVRVGTGSGDHSVVCGAQNFAVGDRVALAPPGAVLPGDFRISAREAYGRTSDGMICSARELGIGDDHTGILVLDRDAPLGADVVEQLGLRDEVLDIAVTPDRGYCLSIRGVAREAATATGVAFADPGVGAVAPPASGGFAVTVEDSDGCPRYVALGVTGLDPQAGSPLWLRQRIALAGMRPISLAVDVTNYVMQALGQPLHAFDRALLSGGISIRRAGSDARITTLDDVERALHPEDLLICDASGPIAIAGVMGGRATEVTAATTDVLVESAHFDARSIARTSRRHNLVSEASKRFERGVDPDVAPVAAALAVDLLVRLGGAAADSGGTDIDHRRERVEIVMPVDAPSRRAGRDYPADVVLRRLRDIGAEVMGAEVSGADPVTVVPPSWRPDITEVVDLTEEVIRLEGYDTVPSVLPAAPAGGGLTAVQRARRAVGRALAARGFAEVSPYPFMSEGALDALGLPPDDVRRRARRLANPVAETEPLVRTTLLPGLAAVVASNVSRGLPDVAVFELGTVARARAASPAAPRPGVDGRPGTDLLAGLEASLPAQPELVAVLLTGRIELPGWWGSGRLAAWADAVAAARAVAAAVGAPMEVRRSDDTPPWHPGRCAELRVGDVVVGHAGELHPRACAALDLPARSAAMELDVGALWPWATSHPTAPPLSTYPPALVDVALIVSDSTPAAAVEEALRAGAGELLEDIRLFDYYVGPQVGPHQRSLAYALRFRAPDTTLTDEEVNALRDAAVAEAHSRVGARLRGPAG